MRSYDYRDTRLSILDLIHGYQEFVLDYTRRRWDPFIISFMFNQLPGRRASVLDQMRREIERVYARLATRFDRNPRSLAGLDRLPRMILFPDLPVSKHEKKSIREVSINDGLHYQGIALTPPVSRLQSTVDRHFKNDQEKYVNAKLARIHVTPITRDPDYVTDYLAKSFKRGRVSDEDVIILPKAISELPSK